MPRGGEREREKGMRKREDIELQKKRRKLLKIDIERERDGEWDRKKEGRYKGRERKGYEKERGYRRKGENCKKQIERRVYKDREEGKQMR